METGRNQWPHPSTEAARPPPPIANPYVQTSPADGTSGKRPKDKICDVLSRLGKKVEVGTRKAEGFAGSVWHHLKIGPSLTDAAMSRLAEGTKVLAEGGHEKVFHQRFSTIPGEKLCKTYACYLSTSSGPVIGTLYVSTERLAFFSDEPLYYCNPSGQYEWVHYKVVVGLDQLMAVHPSVNRSNPTDKYIEILTKDGHEFWFMGFVSYDKALKTMEEAARRAVARRT